MSQESGIHLCRNIHRERSMHMSTYIAQHPATVEEVLTMENLKRYEEQSLDKECMGLRHLMNCQEHVFVPFNNGWIIWRPILDHDRKAMHIACLYMSSDSEIKGMPLWDAIREEARHNGAKVITMETHRDPELWKKKAGFEVTSYHMEYNLGDYNEQ